MNPWQLSNGLRVYLLPSDTPFTAVVLGYSVGAAHEPPGAAGVAHLLEHLLFEDEEIAYDRKLQAVGGSTNAYTGQDYTVYYVRVPREKVALALELEAQRLFNLHLSPEKIAIQRQVVAEEFRQRYLNPPYADRFFHILPRIFPEHPYGTMVIGESPEQVLVLPDAAVRTFYDRFYVPAHAVLCVAGGGIDEGLSRVIHTLYERPKEALPLPPVPSTEGLPFGETFVQVFRPVPQKVVLWAFRLPPLQVPFTHAVDLLDDYLGEPRAGFLTRKLVYEKQVASRLSVSVWQLYQGGVWFIEAYLPDQVDPTQYEAELEKALAELLEAPLEDVLSLYRPLRYLALHRERAKVLGRALALVHAVLAGHPEWYEAPLAPYESLSLPFLREVLHTVFIPENRVRLWYLPAR